MVIYLKVFVKHFQLQRGSVLKPRLGNAAMMYWVTIPVGILLPLLTITRQANTNFTITPSQQVVGIGQETVFRCLHPNTTFISWRINESIIVMDGSPGPPGIIAGRTLDGSGTAIEFILTIMAQPIYNGTEIVCIATFLVGNVPNEETISVNLTIQGPLSMVTDIMRDSSTITWEAPFSLDLTGVDPDIVYCVEVYNITCGVDDLVVGDCNVTEPHFVDNRLQQGYIYRIVIVPRSNGRDSQNGKSNTKEEMFTSLTDPRSIITSANRSMVTAMFQFRIEGTGVEAALYSLTLNTIDEAEKLTSVKIFVQDTSSTNVSVIQSLPRRRRWSYQVLALNCSQHPVTSLLELSTHDFQSVTVSSPSPGLVRVTGDFINGSSATSILIIIYSTDNRNNVYYTISSLSTEGETLMTNISGLTSGLYNVSVFVLEENGLPFNRSASTPRNVLVGENQGDENGNFLIEYEVQSTSTGVCITCTFLDSSTTDCVAVVHQRISQLSSSGLMNIESSHKFNRSSDSNTVQGCIPALDLELYQIGVVGGRLNIRRQPNQGPSLVELIVGTVVGVVIVAVVVAVVLFIVIHKRQAIHCLSQTQQEQQQQSGDSSSLKPLTTPPGIVQDEEAYDVLRGPQKTSVSKEVHDEEAYSVLQREPLQQKTSASKAGVHYLSVNLGPSSGVMVPDLHKPTEQYSELQQQEAEEEEEEEEESFNEGTAAGSADNRCSDGGDATQGGLHLDVSDESVPSCFHSVQSPTMAAELTLLCTEEGPTTCITQCTDEGSTDGQTYLLALDGKQTNYVQGHRRCLYPVIVRASGVCNEGQHKDITLYTKFL